MSFLASVIPTVVPPFVLHHVLTANRSRLYIRLFTGFSKIALYVSIANETREDITAIHS